MVLPSVAKVAALFDAQNDTIDGNHGECRRCRLPSMKPWRQELDDGSLWELERRLWLEGVAVYETAMNDSCLMALPGMGVVKAPDILRGLKDAPRWHVVRMEERTTAKPAANIVVLAYRAHAEREDQRPYNCLCTSTYLLSGAQWTLIQHQQTPQT